jgi:outer membrane protein
MNIIKKRLYRLYLCSFLLLTSINSPGQTLHELLKQAELNYPLLKAKAFEVEKGQYEVSSARSAAIPSLDVAYQVNYATYNNITGMSISQYLIPISGPPTSGNTYDGVYGSAAGALLNWQPFTFGQRKSQIDLAKADLSSSKADETNELFQHQVKVINMYLDVLMAQELIKVDMKNVDRFTEKLKDVRTLAQSGLKPWVDSSLFNAELSRAKIELYSSRKDLAIKEVHLSELLAVGEVQYAQDSDYFRKLPVMGEVDSSVIHPLIRLSKSNLEISKTRKSIMLHTLYPRLTFWGAAYARGSGIRYDGYINSQDGLSFSRYNYGVGLQLSVPILHAFEIRPQIRQQNASIQADEEKLNTITLQLQKQQQTAEVMLKNAFTISAENAVFYASAEYAYRAVSSRYNSGLSNFADLVQAQYGLVKAETDLKKSYMEVWKSLLYKAAVTGDLSVFLNQVQ